MTAEDQEHREPVIPWRTEGGDFVQPLPRQMPQHLSRAIDRERRRIAKASAVLRCLVLVLQHVSEEPIEVELLADVAFGLIEKAIDRLERLT